MIKSFGDKDTKALYKGKRVRRFQAFQRGAERKLAMLESAVTLDDLTQPPGNRLHALKGDRAGQYSISINDQWRVCFRWSDGHAYDVAIVDYHR